MPQKRVPNGHTPEDRNQKSEAGTHENRPKLFFLLDQTFFLRGPKSFSLGCFFRVWGGFFRFFSEVPHPNPKSNKRNCTRTAPPCRRAQSGKKWPRRGQPRYGYMKLRCTPAHPPRQPKAKNSKNLNLGPQTASFGAKLYANRRSSTSCVDPARFQHQRTQS